MASQPAVQHESGNKLVVLNNQLAKGAEQFKAVLPAHITPEAFQRTILTAVQTDPALLDADRQSLLLSCMKAAQDGLLPDKREAAFVIFSTSKKDGDQWIKTQTVQYMPMVYGLRKKILQSGAIKDITAKVVYRCELDAGAFVYEEGDEATLRHRPMLEMTEEQAADSEIVAAYSKVTFNDGSTGYEVMRRFEINKVRQASQTGAVGKTVMFGKDKGRPITPKGPWVDWFPEQAKKTVMRRHSKTLPMSGDLLDVEVRDDELAARSVHAALSAPTAAPLPPMPTRLSVVETVDADGVVIEATATQAAEPELATEAKPARAAKAKPAPANPASGTVTLSVDDMENIECLLIDRISKAMDPTTAKRIFDETPESFEPERVARVRAAFAARDKALRAEANNG